MTPTATPFLSVHDASSLVLSLAVAALVIIGLYILATRGNKK